MTLNKSTWPQLRLGLTLMNLFHLALSFSVRVDISFMRLKTRVTNQHSLSTTKFTAPARTSLINHKQPASLTLSAIHAYIAQRIFHSTSKKTFRNTFTFEYQITSRE